MCFFLLLSCSLTLPLSMPHLTSGRTSVFQNKGTCCLQSLRISLHFNVPKLAATSPMLIESPTLPLKMPSAEGVCTGGRSKWFTSRTPACAASRSPWNFSTGDSILGGIEVAPVFRKSQLECKRCRNLGPWLLWGSLSPPAKWGPWCDLTHQVVLRVKGANVLKTRTQVED